MPSPKQFVYWLPNEEIYTIKFNLDIELMRLQISRQLKVPLKPDTFRYEPPVMGGFYFYCVSVVHCSGFHSSMLLL